MSETWWESVKMSGAEAIDHVRRLVHEGNVRRIVVKQDDRIIAEFPLTVGVVGAVFAPVLAAVGAMVALLTDCTLDVEREGVPATSGTTTSGGANTSTPAASAEGEPPAKDVGSFPG